MVVGFYHFLWPGNITEQAQYFVEQCASVPGDPLAYDWETTTAGTYASNREKDAFLAEVNKLRPDHMTGLYCNVNFWTGHDTTSDCGDFLWIAAPSATAGAPPIQHAWTFHQYSSHDSLDRNVADFTSQAALRTWAESLTEDDVALTDDDINKIADAVYSKIMKTDGVLASPVDAVDHDTNPYWTLQSHVQATTTAARKAATDTTAILDQLKILDAAALEAALAARINGLKVTVTDPSQS
jgi:hypothetical protein